MLVGRSYASIQAFFPASEGGKVTNLAGIRHWLLQIKIAVTSLPLAKFRGDANVKVVFLPPSMYHLMTQEAALIGQLAIYSHRAPI